MKEVSYQVERRTPKGGWEQLAPTVNNDLEALHLCRAHRIHAREGKTGGVFRLVKAVRTEVRA